MEGLLLSLGGFLGFLIVPVALASNLVCNYYEIDDEYLPLGPTLVLFLINVGLFSIHSSVFIVGVLIEIGLAYYFSTFDPYRTKKAEKIKRRQEEEAFLAHQRQEEEAFLARQRQEEKERLARRIGIKVDSKKIESAFNLLTVEACEMIDSEEQLDDLLKCAVEHRQARDMQRLFL